MHVLHLKAALTGSIHGMGSPQRCLLAAGTLAALLGGVGAYKWLVERLHEPAEAAAAGAALTLLLAIGVLLVTCLDIAVSRRRDSERENAHLRRRERELFSNANYDGLTGLPNRRLIEDRFRSAVQRARRGRKSFAFYRVHLPEFDGVGQDGFDAADDQYLVTVATRLLNAVRNSDTVIRIGRGEFVVIVEAIVSPQELSAVTDRLLKAIAVRSPRADTLPSGSRHSLGLAVFPNHGDQVDTMLTNAQNTPCHRHNMRRMLSSINSYEWGQYWATCEQV
jgi:diguanylate cyclase (GGDEF)-like protein